jgi:hypothetical protein
MPILILMTRSRYRKIGQSAYWYYWTHVPDGRNGCGGAHHANEQPFVFHVLSETPEELKEDDGKYHIVRRAHFAWPRWPRV